MNEAQCHPVNSFLTLTYDQTNLPPDGSLDVKHWQDFVKRARKKYKFRYFHCGEYGDKSITKETPLGRPHYHACIFGEAWLKDRQFYKLGKNGDRLYTSDALAELWPQGIHAIGDLTFESAAYTARYIMKKATGLTASYKKYGEKINYKTGEVKFRYKPEYITMSRRPGIGSKWITKFLADVYPSDEVITRGVQCRPPKYYDQHLEKVDPIAYKKLKVKRARLAVENESENTYTRLEVRERVKLAKIKYFSRDLT